MPIFTSSDNLFLNSNNELYKKYMNEKYNIELIFNFYWKILSNDEKLLENHPLLSKRLMKLSQEYFLVKDKNETVGNGNETTSKLPVKNILYKNLIPLDLSPDNFLFMKFMKFHFGFVKFSQWYKPNSFSGLEVSETIMKDHLTKELLRCITKNKKDLKDKLNTLTDFQLISNVCVKERLTFYNFLAESEIKPSEAKEFINRLYIQNFRGKMYAPNFGKQVKDQSVDKLLNVYSKPKI